MNLIKVKKIIEYLNDIEELVECKGAEVSTVEGFSSIYDSIPNTISWMRSQNIDWDNVHATLIFCDRNCVPPEKEMQKRRFVKVNDPRYTFFNTLTKFSKSGKKKNIHMSAVIHESAEIGNNCYIGPNVVIGKNVGILKGTEIHANVVIEDNVKIGEDCIIYPGAVLGITGFGHQKGKTNRLERVEHIGGVTLGNSVEIGSNTCVARGNISDTMIGNNSKINSLCHIAHNVKIGNNVGISVGVMIAGSVIIEDNVWVAPGSVIKNSVNIKKGAFIGLGSVVIKDVDEITTVAGVPARILEKQM